jgi:hypothetical protein
MTNTLPLEWTNHLKDQKSKENLELLLRNSTVVLGLLSDILNDRLNSVYNQETKLNDFNGDWAFRQAFRNGQKHSLKAVLDLISFAQNKGHK